MWERQQEAPSAQMGQTPCAKGQASEAPNQPPKAPTMPCGLCGWYVGAHRLTTSTHLSNQPIVPANPPCGSHRAAGAWPLSQGSPCLLLIKVTVRKEKGMNGVGGGGEGSPRLARSRKFCRYEHGTAWASPIAQRTLAPTKTKGQEGQMTPWSHTADDGGVREQLECVPGSSHTERQIWL